MIENYNLQLIQFRFALLPFFDLMDYKQMVLPLEDWLKFVTAIKSRIIESPEQFLGREVPRADLLKQMIGDIFDEYLAEKAPLNSVELSSSSS